MLCFCNESNWTAKERSNKAMCKLCSRKDVTETLEEIPTLENNNLLTTTAQLANERGINLSKFHKSENPLIERDTGGVEPQHEMSLLQLLALNALDLTAPAANDLLLENRKNDWVQLSGHRGAFSPAGYGTIWKRRSATDETEVQAYRVLMNDPAKDHVPRFFKEAEYKGEFYIEMQDLLHGFRDPYVMDIKMGTRTFTEPEVKNQTPRADLYKKMVAVDPSASTEEENARGAITKLRYMEFREKLSSTSTLGFRIEAVKHGRAPPVTNLQLMKSKEQILQTLNRFLSGGTKATKYQIVNRLKSIRRTVEASPFFQTHEIIGSSILVVYDHCRAGVWTIDFAKTIPLPKCVRINHRTTWQHGNHEDGYLSGLDNLTEIFEGVTVPQS